MESLPALRSLGRRRSPAPSGRGFTLVEMLVVVAIIVTITTIVVSGQSAYNRSILLTNTAYTVAYSVRQAQSLGLASRGRLVDSAVASNFGYGIYFTGSTGYTVFADTTGTPEHDWCDNGIEDTPEEKRGDCRYDSGDQILQSYTFGRGYTISNVCGKTSSGGTCTAVSALHIVFRRPETQAIMTGYSGSSSYNFVCAQVTVEAPTGGDTRTIRVSRLGEISVGQTCP